MTTVVLREKIDINDTERAIFNLLRRAVSNFKPDMQIRVAGGWVRDKLLGQDSNDIDIAIENMSGKDFLDKLNEYLSSQGEKEVEGHFIKSNSEKSKHLETAKMCLHKEWIDLVSLRSEKHNEHSRIPEKRDFASPDKDAYRRDLTINRAYSTTFTVEDFTDRGIADLKSGIIVTPLHAKTTFLDDPLRVLRAIRFGTRFGFTLDEEVIEAASSEEVRDALAEKISRERIGSEIDKMIKGNNPVSAVTYLSDFELFGVVFALPSSSQPASSDVCRAYMEAMWNLIQTDGLIVLNDKQIRLALYAALFLPYKDDNGELVNYIFKYSLKQKTRNAETVIKIHRATERFLSLILPLQLKKEVELDKLEWATDVVEHLESISLIDPKVTATSKLKVVTGFLLRDIKDLWPVALLASLLLYNDEDGMNLDKKREIYRTVKNKILQLNLDMIWDVKPLMSGNAIIEKLKNGGLVINEGLIVGEWEMLRFTQKKMLTWQLAYHKENENDDNAAKGSAEECISWINQTYGQSL